MWGGGGGTHMCRPFCMLVERSEADTGSPNCRVCQWKPCWLIGLVGLVSLLCSHLHPPSEGWNYRWATLPALFIWVLGIQILILILVWHKLSPHSHVPCAPVCRSLKGSHVAQAYC